MDKRLYLLGACIIMIIAQVQAYGEWQPTFIYNKTNSVSPYSFDNVRGITLYGDLLISTSETDDEVSIQNITNKLSWEGEATDAGDSSGTDSLDGAYDTSVVGQYLAALSNIDYTISLWNISNPASMVFLGGYANNAPPCSIEGSVDIELEIRTINGKNNTLVHVAGRTDDEYSIINFTNLAGIACLSRWVRDGAPCGVDNIYTLQIDPTRNITYVCANADDGLGAINTTNLANFTCITSNTSSSTPSVDGCLDMDIIPELDYKYLVVTAPDDSAFSIWNLSNVPTTKAMRGMGEYANNSNPGTSGNCSIYALNTLAVGDDGRTVFAGARRSSGAFSLTNKVISAFNISDMWNPTCIGSYTPPSQYCNLNYTYDSEAKDGYVYQTFLTGDCVVVYNYTDMYPASTNTCTYGGSGDWQILASDNCVWNSNVNVLGNINIVSSGTLTLNAIFDVSAGKSINFGSPGITMIINNGGSIR